MRQAKEIGIDVPDSLEGWADFFPRYTELPWLKGRDHARLQVMRDYLRIAFDRIPIAATIAIASPGPLRRHLDSGTLAARPRRVRSSRGALAQQQAEEQDVPHEAGCRCEAARAGTGGGLLMRGKVVLFYPPYDGPPLSAPLCLLALAAPLREAGFSVAVIDAAIAPDYRAEVLRECRMRSVSESRYSPGR